MDNSFHFDGILLRYLTKNNSAEEKDFVEQWINESEENKKYFEDLQLTWNLGLLKDLEKINVEEEWEFFGKSIISRQSGVQSITQAENVPSEQRSETESTARSPIIYRLLTVTAVAALLLLLLGVGWKVFYQEKKETQVARQPVKTENFDRPQMQWVHNTSGKASTLQLEEGTIIVLANNSEVRYLEPFTGNKREIFLKGKADFRVSKNKNRPFSVYSGDLATTVLGTEFTVTAFEQEPNITVRLYEGRVMVQSVQDAPDKLKKDYYLQPGQELVYQKKFISAKVRAFKTKNGMRKGIQQEKPPAVADKPKPEIPDFEGSWYMFNNQSLPEIFEQLESLFDTKIEVRNKKALQKYYFIGKFDKNDSLEYILRNIAILNNLTVKKEKNKYIVSK